jgi:hypothetical protein
MAMEKRPTRIVWTEWMASRSRAYGRNFDAKADRATPTFFDRYFCPRRHPFRAIALVASSDDPFGIAPAVSGSCQVDPVSGYPIFGAPVFWRPGVDSEKADWIAIWLRKRERTCWWRFLLKQEFEGSAASLATRLMPSRTQFVRRMIFSGFM